MEYIGIPLTYQVYNALGRDKIGTTVSEEPSATPSAS